MALGSYTITLSDDNMAAWIRFHTEAPIPLAQLQSDIAAASIVYGIDQFFIADLAEARQSGQDYCIASGTAAEEGLEYGFSLRTTHPPKRLPGGRVDFYNLDTVQNVLQQQILVTKIPPHACAPGRTVCGGILAPSGREAPLPTPGSHVAVAEDGMSLIALTNGHPVLVDDVLSVEPTYTVEGDVDFSVGNLTCVGHVVVMGDIKNGFSIKGAQNITIHGVVDGGSIDAGGSVYLSSNTFGRHKSHIKSAASVEGVYVDATVVEARKDIRLQRGARHSDLHAGGSILVQGDAGHIIGGTVRSHGRILTQNLGSEHEVPTHVEILPAAYDTATSTTFLAHINAILEEDRMCLEQGLARDMPAAQIEAITTRLHQCRQAADCLTSYVRERQRLLPILPLQLGTIVATGTVYPGVTVCIGDASWLVKEPMHSVMFCKIEGAVQVRTLEEPWA